MFTLVHTKHGRQKKMSLSGLLWDFDEENICCCEKTRLFWSELANGMTAFKDLPFPVWETKV